MSNQAWECPRCKRINAPFNPSCFCQPEDKLNEWEKVLKQSKLDFSSLSPGWVANCQDCGGMINVLTKHTCKVSL